MVGCSGASTWLFSRLEETDAEANEVGEDRAAVASPLVGVDRTAESTATALRVLRRQLVIPLLVTDMVGSNEAGNQ